ncbi:hypothetical protein H257_11185 [Aphanomyces astaci]|uniref:Tc3 transposase DNA binding domain-containing protein n=1 Tax=Aphanomyces astaci TaxID=112090 RepID=W4G4P3_APHAT|nr:hypothetical protein H257_11185 [Aphanomyces astaci]ETV74251.1 hypothetical protein H257_11185 [Aphanomyces astaci]|eukprot:XP_009836357.1 hypothetical protein H257_11185 [Aphanomyces astaci]
MTSPEERACVETIRRHGLSIRSIAKELGRNKNAIAGYLKNPEGYGTRFRGIAKIAVVGREYRLLIREASNTGQSVRRLKTDLNIDASLRTIQRRLKEAPTVTYEKRKHTPMLGKVHMQKRVKYAQGNLREPTNWTEIISSDEKKFNLDGPLDKHLAAYEDWKSQDKARLVEAQEEADLIDNMGVTIREEALQALGKRKSAAMDGDGTGAGCGSGGGVVMKMMKMLHDDSTADLEFRKHQYAMDLKERETVRVMDMKPLWQLAIQEP